MTRIKCYIESTAFFKINSFNFVLFIDFLLPQKSAKGLGRSQNYWRGII